MNDKPKVNNELDMARYVAEAIGDECGTVFVTNTVMLRQDGTHQDTWNVAAFHGSEIVVHVYDHPRLDQAGLQAVREFSEYLTAKAARYALPTCIPKLALEMFLCIKEKKSHK